MKNFAVEMKNITVIFNEKIIANDNISLKIKKGEIHAIIGENGAGKSTLMSVLFGIYKPTKGSIFINGNEENISGPVVATKLGIGMVHQHFQIVDIFPLWQNISLGCGGKSLFINKNKIIKEIKSIMDKYGIHVDLLKIAKKASIVELQKAEILKLLYKNTDILIFDEPSAVLSPSEIDSLLEVILELKKQGKTIILITHKMNEIKKVADTATIIRRGKFIGEYDIKTTAIETLANEMVGRKIIEVYNDLEIECGEKVINIENLTMEKHDQHKAIGLENFNLSINEGEIVGIAGVEGNGQHELVNAITGLQKIKSGEIYIKNNIKNDFELLNKKSINYRRNYVKISHVPVDRQKHGLVLNFPVKYNMVLGEIDNPKFLLGMGMINYSSINFFSNHLINKFDIRNCESGNSITSSLSGGNQQKIIVAREFSRDYNFIVIFQPTRGVDVGSIELIHNEILKAKKLNKAILLVSFELSEILALSDRVIVLNNGKIAGELDKKNANYEKIGRLMVGE